MARSEADETSDLLPDHDPCPASPITPDDLRPVRWLAVEAATASAS